MGTTLEMTSSTTLGFSGGFEKTDDIVHYRTGPRVSSGFLSSRDDGSSSNSNSSLNVSPNAKVLRTNNSYNRRKIIPSIKPGTKAAASSSSVDQTIIKDTGVSNTKSSPSSTTTYIDHRRNFATKAGVAVVPDYDEVVDKVPEESAFTPSKKMPPNNRSQSQDDGSAIISGHKIALNVHYDSEKHSQHLQQNGVLGAPPGSAGSSSSEGVAPMIDDEQPALRELDEVIASAQRSASSARRSASPEHAAEEYVDAADIFQVDEAMQLDEKITHVDRVSSGPGSEEGLSVAASPHPSASSLGDFRAPSPSSPSPVEEAERHTPFTGSTASVDGGALSSSPATPTKRSASPLPLTEAIMTVSRDQYLNGPDQLIPATSLKTWIPNGAVTLRVEKEGLATNTPISVPTMLKRTAEKYPNITALMEKQGNEWVGINYSQYYQMVRTAAKAFIKLGLEPFHGVCILGYNSPEWFISDLAAIFAGGSAAGIYTTNSADACQQCALNCQAQIWVVEDQKSLDKVLKIRPNVPSLKTIIQYKGKPTTEGVLSWEDVMEIGRNESDAALEERLKRIAVNQCCTLIYTSGTTGAPKGVMLSHDNITFTSLSASIYFKMNPGIETIISYLPLSHVAAQLADIYMAMINAGTVYFAQPDALKGSLGATLKEVRPTVFLGVPRVWEKIYEKMMDVGRKTKGVKKSIATWAKSLGLEANDRKQKSDYSKPLGFSVANAIVFKKVKQVLGFDRCRLFLSGAAPISPDIVKYFHSLDICLVEIYGMSESTGPHTTGIEQAFKVGSAGRSLPGFKTLIYKADQDGNGEVCMAGRNVAMGYLLKEEATSETIDDDGMLHTGDIGKLDEGNFLFITGRIKELIITAGGENIPPVLIEDILKGELSCISNAMLIGDKRKFLSILLTLKTNMNLDSGEALDTLSPACIEWCEGVGSSAKTIYDVLSGPDAKIMRAIQDGIDRANKKATSNAQKIQKWTILPRDFTVLGDELGPTMKLKRPVVSKKYSETIERFYQ